MDTEIKFLKQLATNEDELVFAFDSRASSFVFISPSIGPILGIEVEQVQENPSVLNTMLHPDDRSFVLEELNSLMRNKKAIRMEFRLLLPNARIKWLCLKAYPVSSSTGQQLVAGMAEDITRRKEYELNLYDIKEQKNTVLQILGHDLRAPLHTIQMSTNLLRDELQEASEDTRKIFNIITTTCRNSLQMIGRILEVEFLEMQKTELTTTRTELVSRIRNQIDTYLIGDDRKQFSIGSNKPTVYARVDVVRFILIIENIISNAYKFTAPEGKIDIHIEEKEETVLISIADNGIGIPEKHKPIIFDKFTKARRVGLNGSRPVGLGMHIIKKMVEMHQGKIWFESEEGVGTAFYVEVPR